MVSTVTANSVTLPHPLAPTGNRPSLFSCPPLHRGMDDDSFAADTRVSAAVQFGRAGVELCE